jgi:hypothetical protein
LVYPAVQANTIYEGVYLLGTSLARPVIARRQVRKSPSMKGGKASCTLVSVSVASCERWSYLASFESFSNENRRGIKRKKAAKLN